MLVHGLGPWSQSLSSWQSSCLLRPWTRLFRVKAAHCGRQVADLAERLAGAAETVGCARSDVVVGALCRPTALSPKRKASLAAQGTQNFVDPFYHGSGNCDAVAAVRADARVTLRPQQSPCALCSASFVAKYPLRGLRLSRGGTVLAPFRGREPSSGTPSGGTSFRPPVAPQVPSRGFRLGGLPKRFAWPLAVS